MSCNVMLKANRLAHVPADPVKRDAFLRVLQSDADANVAMRFRNCGEAQMSAGLSRGLGKLR